MQKFIDDLNIGDNFFTDLENVSTQTHIQSDNLTENIKHTIAKYEFYVNDTLAGKRGKTAQFWMQYATIIDLSNILHRAIKQNDPDLFAYALFELSPIFFMTNHVNYARWMVFYSLELANLNTEIKAMLRNGGFSVNRSGKPFSEVAVDMALEQTINADAKNRLKGIMKYADVSTAVNRWTVTNSMKSELVNRLLEIYGMSESSSGHKETQGPRMKRDNRDLSKLKKAITETMNPFDENLNKNILFNIKTGRKANIEAEEYLLNIFNRGLEKRDTFVDACKNDANRFESTITKTKITNFVTDNAIKKNKSRKVTEVINIKGTRDLFGRLLHLAVTHNLSIEKILEYPLLPEPPCFCHPDGSMYQSDKSFVFDYLTKNTVTSPPDKACTVVVDGMFMIKNTINQRCPTFSAFARNMLMKVLKLTTHRADLCFDV